MLTSQITPLLHHQQIIYPTYFFSSLQTHVSISCRLYWAFFSIWVLFWVCLNERFLLYQPHITTLYCHTFNSLFLVFPPWTLMLKNVSYNLNAVANIFLSKWILCYLNSGGAMPCLLRFYFEWLSCEDTWITVWVSFQMRPQLRLCTQLWWILSVNRWASGHVMSTPVRKSKFKDLKPQQRRVLQYHALPGF